MRKKTYRTQQLLISRLILICGFFLLFGSEAFGIGLKSKEQGDTIRQPEIELHPQKWKLGVAYTYLPLPKIDEGTVKLGELGISLEYRVRPKLWLGTGLGVSYWEYHNRVVTRTIDQILIDPTTKAISYTFIDSVSGNTNKFNLFSVPARFRFDLIDKKNQTIFISSGANFNMAFRELVGFEDNDSSGKTIGPPDSFTFNTFGLFDLGYEYKQFQGFSTTLCLQYRRTLYSQGIPMEAKNYFGFKVGICYYFTGN